MNGRHGQILPGHVAGYAGGATVALTDAGVCVAATSIAVLSRIGTPCRTDPDFERTLLGPCPGLGGRPPPVTLL